MFCLIYITPSNSPNVLELSQSQSSLSKIMEEKAIQQCIDEVGRKNFVNTLDDEKELNEIVYPVYPSLTLKRINENQIQVYKVEKKQIVDKGYLYNSYKDVVEVILVSNYFVCGVENWKYEDLPQRPRDENQKTIRPVEKKSDTMLKSYDKVLLELIENIQKRKISM
jgi:hypothetical protein